MKAAYLFSLALVVALVGAGPPGNSQQGKILHDCPTGIVIAGYILRIYSEIVI